MMVTAHANMGSPFPGNAPFELMDNSAHVDSQPPEMQHLFHRTLGWPLRNVWLGTSVEDHVTADTRIPYLLSTPAAVRFLRCEPLLGPVDMKWCWLNRMALCGECPSSDEGTPIDCPCADERIDWIVAGGESGPGARPMHPDWAKSLRDQCAAAGTAYFFKQWGNWVPGHYSESRHTALLDTSRGHGHGITLGAPPHDPSHVHDWGDGFISINVGKHRAGRLLDGVEHNGFPEGHS